MRSSCQRIPQGFGGRLTRFSAEPREQPLGGPSAGALMGLKWQHYAPPALCVRFDAQMGDRLALPQDGMGAIVALLDDRQGRHAGQFDQAGSLKMRRRGTDQHREAVHVSAPDHPFRRSGSVRIDQEIAAPTAGR